ncbi:MAG: ABC transporter ATP-binding protein [Acidobacteria bacterium]|nr:ABC transporter ATP-binding protein [Acidobacteriota bacterium]
MVHVENLTRRFGDRTAVSKLNFRVAPGEVFGILGPNGSGKSTLFRIMATMLAPSEGTIRVNGFDVTRQPDRVRASIGVVFQSFSLDRKLTVDENLVAQGNLYGLSGADLRGRIEASASRLGLAGRRRDLVGTLSGGLQRRVEIAKALLHQPAVLLMDEPSTGLDPAARRELGQYVDELRAAGVTILVTTHILDEADRCDRLLLMHEGRRVAEGTPAELKARVGGDVVVLETEQPERLSARLKERFGVAPSLAGGALRVEIANAHRFVAEAIEAFPGAIEAVALHKPTLEDVFLDLTGARIS